MRRAWHRQENVDANEGRADRGDPRRPAVLARPRGGGGARPLRGARPDGGLDVRRHGRPPRRLARSDDRAPGGRRTWRARARRALARRARRTTRSSTRGSASTTPGDPPRTWSQAYEASYDRLIAAIDALPERLLTDPEAFAVVGRAARRGRLHRPPPRGARPGRPRLARRRVAPPDRSGERRLEQLPLARDAAQRGGAQRPEHEVRARREVADRARGDDLAVGRGAEQACRDVDRDAGDARLAPLDLPGVEARPASRCRARGPPRPARTRTAGPASARRRWPSPRRR